MLHPFEQNRINNQLSLSTIPPLPDEIAHLFDETRIPSSKFSEHGILPEMHLPKPQQKLEIQNNISHQPSCLISMRVLLTRNEIQKQLQAASTLLAKNKIQKQLYPSSTINWGQLLESFESFSDEEKIGLYHVMKKELHINHAAVILNTNLQSKQKKPINLNYY